MGWECVDEGTYCPECKMLCDEKPGDICSNCGECKLIHVIVKTDKNQATLTDFHKEVKCSECGYFGVPYQSKFLKAQQTSCKRCGQVWDMEPH